MLCRSEHGPCIEWDNRTLREIQQELTERLKAIPWTGSTSDGASLLDLFEYGLGLACDQGFGETAWYHKVPTQHWRVICYAVWGGSEGHYLHIDVLHRESGCEHTHRTGLFTGKLLCGHEPTLLLVNVICKLMGLV